MTFYNFSCFQKHVSNLTFWYLYEQAEKYYRELATLLVRPPNTKENLYLVTRQAPIE
jgi:hypothetical protein